MKDILVHLNDTDTLASRVGAACAIARQFEAGISGIFTKRQLMYEVYGTLVNPDTVDEFLMAQNEAAGKAKAMFEKLLKVNSPTGDIRNKYIEVTGDPTQKLVRYACVHDLVVVGKGQQENHKEELESLAANVVLESGRPILLVPSKLKSDDIGKSILVAWNGTAEAARAVHDAMPLLQAAESVNVVTFHPAKNESHSVLDITEHLEHYNVIFDVSDTTSEDYEIMSNMRRLIDSFETDLVVMGAYGHSRFREYILGGVSRSAIRDLSVPLFLSH